jgi:response regulator of citrate/malate metabolism
MICTRILIIAHSGANLDSLYAVLPGLIDGVVLQHSAEVSHIESLIRDSSPNLVLVDTEIGYQYVRAIHELLTTRYPQVRIIILSDAAHWQHWKTLRGSHQVLLKGFSSRRLKVTLSKVLSAPILVELRSPTQK